MTSVRHVKKEVASGIENREVFNSNPGRAIFGIDVEKEN